MAIRPRLRHAAFALAALVVSPVALLLTAHLLLAINPDLAKRRALDAARSACGCEVDWRDWNVRLLQGEWTLRDFTLNAGRSGDELHIVEARELRARLRIPPLFSGRAELALLALAGLDYQVREWDEGPSAPDSPGAMKESRGDRPEQQERKGPALSVSTLTAANSRFRYRRVYGEGREATVTVREISLEASPAIVGKGLSRVALRGTLEESGGLELEVEGDLAKSLTPPVSVRLALSDFPLSEANDYFRIADGIELDGKLIAGEANLHLEGHHLTGEIKIRYRGLDAKFLSGESRGAISAFFQSLAADVVLDEENTGESARNLRAGIDYRREPGESVFRLLLRGMRDGAMRIARSKDKDISPPIRQAAERRAR